MIILLIIILLLLFFNNTEGMNGNVNWNNMNGNNMNSNEYRLKGSRIGEIDNMDRILMDDKIRKHYKQIQRQFPLSVREPILNSSVSENIVNENLLKKGGVKEPIDILSIQNPKRIAENNPTPINEIFNKSSGSKNIIQTQPELYNLNLLNAFDILLNKNGIKENELIGVEWQEIDRNNFFKANELKVVISDFIQQLNNTLSSITGVKGAFTYLDKEDAVIEKSYPISMANSSTNLGKEYTKYTIIFYIQDQNALTNRGIKGIFIKTGLNKPRIYSLDIIGEKGDTVIGASETPKFYKIDDSNKQKITQKFIDSELNKIAIKNKTPQYTCFGVSGGLSLSESECKIKGGIYDTPVKNNEDCPYYKHNKNYENSRGGTRGGYCEMPVGVLSRGFRNIDPNNNKPLCYNCIEGQFGRKSIGECCEEQRQDRIKYPTLKSPDYVFPSDELDRFYNRNQLHSLDLSWNKKGFAFENELPTGVSNSAFLV